MIVVAVGTVYFSILAPQYSAPAARNDYGTGVPCGNSKTVFVYDGRMLRDGIRPERRFREGICASRCATGAFEYGIRPEIIAGVSIGAVAGVFIADGKRPEEVLELFMSREFRSFTGFTRSRGGFMNLDNFYGFLRDTLSVGRIEELSLPLAVTATNLDTGRSVHFREGEIAPPHRGLVLRARPFHPPSR